MNNPFTHHGLEHLSPSSLNLYIEQPGIWAAQYLAGQKGPGNAKMWRGNAVEQGYVAYLRTGNVGEAYETAMRSFNLKIEANAAQGEAADKQGALIEPMLSQCMLWTPPSDLNAAQIEVEYWFENVPIRIKGYVDLAFEGIDVDLKTKEKLNPPSQAEIRQVSFYRAARNKPGGLLYVTDKKHRYVDVTDEMMVKGLEDLEDAARKVTKLLNTFEDATDILSILPIDYSHYRAPKERIDARTAGRAAMDFEPVELETT